MAAHGQASVQGRSRWQLCGTCCACTIPALARTCYCRPPAAGPAQLPRHLLAPAHRLCWEGPSWGGHPRRRCDRIRPSWRREGETRLALPLAGSRPRQPSPSPFSCRRTACGASGSACSCRGLPHSGRDLAVQPKHNHLLGPGGGGLGMLAGMSTAATAVQLKGDGQAGREVAPECRSHPPHLHPSGGRAGRLPERPQPAVHGVCARQHRLELLLRRCLCGFGHYMHWLLGRPSAPCCNGLGVLPASVRHAPPSPHALLRPPQGSRSAGTSSHQTLSCWEPCSTTTSSQTER